MFFKKTDLHRYWNIYLYLEINWIFAKIAFACLWFFLLLKTQYWEQEPVHCYLKKKKTIIAHGAWKIIVFLTTIILHGNISREMYTKQ